MPVLFPKNLYAELGIDSSASHDEIRKAYRKRALETHPDKLDPGATESEKHEAENQFHKVHNAFEILGDEIKRKAYDIRMKARSDPGPLSPGATRRIDERSEWARRQSEERQKHSAAFFAEIEREKRAKQAAAERLAMQAAMVKELVQDMYSMSPELAARKEAARQRKAERERERELERERERERARSKYSPSSRSIFSVRAS